MSGAPSSAAGSADSAASAGSAIGATVLGALGLLHVSWAAGSPWPARDLATLADVMAGRAEPPSSRACIVVATGLGTAAAVVAGVGGRGRLVRAARAAVAAGFLVRGAAGLTGNTRLLVPWTPNDHFVRLDRQWYGPLCLVIATCAALSATRRPT
jgi:Protein of unknown function (DUF3995)